MKSLKDMTDLELNALFDGQSLIMKAIRDCEPSTLERDILLSAFLYLEFNRTRIQSEGRVTEWWEEQDALDAGLYEEYTFDGIIRAFITAAHAGETDEKLAEILAPMHRTISTPMVGPFFGTQAGLARLGRLNKLSLSTLETQAEVLRERPGYNDYLMADWAISEEYQLIDKMMVRCFHPNPAIAGSARWMMNSVAQHNEKFKTQLLYYAKRDASGFIRTDCRVLAEHLATSTEPPQRAPEFLQ